MTLSVAFKAIGCRTNQQELSDLGAEFVRRGFVVEPRVEHADVVIVNTCCVTARTEATTRRAIRALSRRAPAARMLITGCMAQNNPHAFDGITGVEWVVGNASKHTIPSIVHGPSRLVHEPFAASPLPLPPPPVITASRTRYALKIQEGCDFACAYCIVPTVRGPSRSLCADAVAEHCRRALDAGFRELVVGGTHIGQYNGCKEGLVGLLELLCNLEGDFRIRLSSLDPRELTPSLCALLACESRIADHCHISVQSLSPEVLTAMGRAFDLQRLYEMSARIRSSRPHFCLGADFIVGFPGESPSLFQQTISAVEELDFSYGHVFRFSPRPGTPAASFSDQIAESEKTRRSLRLRSLLADRTDFFCKRCRGSTQRVIIEKGEPAQGISSNYLALTLRTGSHPPGTMITCRVEEQIEKGTRRCHASETGRVV